MVAPDDFDENAAALEILGIRSPAQAAVDKVKAVATLQARAALAGFELVQLGDGSFIGSKPAWGMHVCLADLASVDAWLVRVGAPA